MSKVNSLLSKRLKKNEQSPKMAALAKRSAAGELHGLSNIFAATELSDSEEVTLRLILERFGEGRLELLESDLKDLVLVTAEVKAINHQAALLHGERIQRAQDILKLYADGAFSSWLIATYGNRQTPYNFLQYYSFYQQIPLNLRPRLEQMPRQAIYTLASRNGEMEIKQEIVQSYDGESKQELLERIRDTFPLDKEDGRRQNTAEIVLNALKKVSKALLKRRSRVGTRQREAIEQEVKLIRSLL